MGISFAGVDLLLEDPGGVFQSWLDRNLSLQDMRLFGNEPVAYREGRDGSRHGNEAGSGLPLLNWSDPPRPKINTLWMPTGASRWGVGLFLASDAQLTEILKVQDEDFDAGRMLILEEHRTFGKAAVTKLEFKMYMLPARSLNDTPSGQNGWLVPLVDRRYFWQWIDTSLISERSNIHDIRDLLPEWDQLISAATHPSVLRGGIDVTQDSISSKYGFASELELVNRPATNIATYLDAIAASVGLRVVFDASEESLHFQSALNANAAYLENVELGVSENKGNESLAGLEIVPTANLKAERVFVFFPRYVYLKSQSQADRNNRLGACQNASANCGTAWREDVEFTDTDVYGEMEAAGENVDSSSISRAAKTFYSTAGADFTLPFSESTPFLKIDPRLFYPDVPNNEAILELIAQQTADDYYRWLRYSYDRSFLGLTEWALTGIDDWIWYHPAYRNPGGGYSSFTRVSSMPYNFGSSEMLNQLIGIEDSWYALAQDDWKENGWYGLGYPRVKCRACDWDGDNQRGDLFWVHLPRKRDAIATTGSGNIDANFEADPAVYEGDVIRWKLDYNSVPICESEYLHMGRIGDVKMIGNQQSFLSLANPPAGWALCDGTRYTTDTVPDWSTFTVADMREGSEDGLGHPNFSHGGSHPKHKDPGGSEAIHDRVKIHHWDAAGSPPIFLPNEGLAKVEYTGGGELPHHALRIASGFYMSTVFNFIQRYK